MISYAQNFEDVMLWRVFRDQGSGFYVDVGAQDPVTDSISKIFYDRGWSGINLEPVEIYHGKLVQSRKRDINLRAGAGRQAGHLAFFNVRDTGLSTTDAEAAALYRSRGHQVDEQIIEIVTLDDVLSQHGVTEVDFLKIDTEGSELDVLLGLSLIRIRPKILVVEVSVEGRMSPSLAAIDSYLAERRYQRAYCDGLNNFYVAEEHQSLSQHLLVPANVTDGFTPYPLHEARHAWKSLEKALKHHLKLIKQRDKLISTQQQQIQDTINHHVGLLQHRDHVVQQQHDAILHYQAHIGALDAQLGALNQRCHEIEQSWSWRGTAPLRALASGIRQHAGQFAQALASRRPFANHKSPPPVSTPLEESSSPPDAAEHARWMAKRLFPPKSP
jgi:FkbM family methyltransferase